MNSLAEFILAWSEIRQSDPLLIRVQAGRAEKAGIEEWAGQNFVNSTTRQIEPCNSCRCLNSC
jgi:hypothetical protein